MENTDRNLSVFITAISISFIAFQHYNVFPYHDDYGLAVLDYVGSQEGFNKTDFTLGKLFLFLKGMYINWSGRVVSLFLLIKAYSYGLDFVRAVQVAIVTSILLISALIIKGRDRNISAAVVAMVACYLALPAAVIKGGLFWFAAASGYVWGLPFLLAGAAMSMRSGRISWASSALIALSATFHEQMAAAALAFVSLFCLSIARRGYRPAGRDFGMLALIAAAALATALAPGNFARANGTSFAETSLPMRFAGNLDRLLEVASNRGSAVFMVLLVLALAVLAVRVVVGHSAGIERMRSRIAVFTASAALFIGIFMLSPKAAAGVVMVCFTILLSLRCLSDGIRGTTILSLFAAGVLSTLLAAAGPLLAGRSLLPLAILTSLAISYVLYRDLRSGWARWPVLAIAIATSGYHSLSVLEGYRRNYETNSVNDYKLRVAAFEHAHGVPIAQAIQLYKLPDPSAAEVMPYQRPLIETWMKKYYGLPPDIAFEWK
jgi:hypothetical protein